MRAILTYHSIDSSGSVISVDEQVLRRQTDWMAASHVDVVSVARLLDMGDEEEGIAITFDDGFANFGSVAWPILRERELPVTVFVVTGHTGGSNDWGGTCAPGIPELPLLDWEALGRMAEEGVAIGSHTVTHPPLVGLASARLEAEFADSADAIERELGRRPAGFAYPYGSLDDRAERAAGGSYAWACTTELAPLGESAAPHRLPRLDAYYFRRAGQLERWGSAAFWARLGLRRAARSMRERMSGGVA